MADFLTRIAERTLGTAPTVQPIIAPIFAPGPILNGARTSSVEPQFIAPSNQDRESSEEFGAMQKIPARGTQRTPRQRGSMPPSPERQDDAPPATPIQPLRRNPANQSKTDDHLIARSLKQVDSAPQDVESGESNSTTFTPLSHAKRSENFSLDTHTIEENAGTQFIAAKKPPSLHVGSEFIAAKKPSSTPVQPVSGHNDMQPNRQVPSAPAPSLTEREQLQDTMRREVSDHFLVPFSKERHWEPGLEGQSFVGAGEDLSRESNVGFLDSDSDHPRLAEEAQRGRGQPPHHPSQPPPPLQEPSDQPLNTGPDRSIYTQIAAPIPDSNGTATPTVKVNIGRIEVRAMPPAPAPASPRPRHTRPGPATSLNDYLRQYNGRQR